ncbi:C-GCAxxG-C-C family protein [Elusimicrobiota bacterium]
MNNTETALSIYTDGYNCCQAILVSFGKKYGLSRETSVRLGMPFMGGIGYSGEVCGAAIGAIMTLGLASKDSVSQDGEYKKYMASRAREFLKKFKEKKGAICCRDIRKIDRKNPLINKHKREGCALAVKIAAEILDEMLHGFV